VETIARKAVLLQLERLPVAGWDAAGSQQHRSRKGPHPEGEAIPTTGQPLAARGPVPSRPVPSRLGPLTIPSAAMADDELEALRRITQRRQRAEGE
jgi:hypothetical protein